MKRHYTTFLTAFALIFSVQTAVFAQRTVYPLPYYETFDTLPTTAMSRAEGWTNVHIQGSYPTVRSQSNMACSGSQELVSMLQNSTQYTLAATPAFVVPAEGLEVRWCCVLGNPEGTLQAGIMTNVAAENTFLPLYNTTVNTLLGRTEGVFYYDATHAGDTVYVAFKCTNSGTASCMFYLDNVAINAAPTHHLMSASVVDTTDHSLTLSWRSHAGVDHYELAYASQNILNQVVATYVENIIDTFYVINNLQMGTPYYLWMRSVYSNDTTAWTPIDIVYTKLADITNHYETDFEGDPYGNPYVPAAWTRVTLRSSRPFIKNSALCNGAQCLEMAGNATANSMVATPRIAMPNGEARCTFTYYCAYNGTLQYGIMTSVANESSFVVLGTVEDTIAPRRTFEINLDTALVPDTFYVAFRFQGKTGTAYGLIDDVKIWREVPVCDRPAQVAINNITRHEADVRVIGSDSTQVAFEMVCTIADSVLASDSIIAIDSTYHLENLLSGNTYNVFVRTVCDSTHRSEWMGPATFTTLGVCDRPAQVAINNITRHEADVRVIGSDSTQVAFEMVCTIADSVLASDSIIAIDSTYHLENLLSGNTYNVFVRTVCDSTHRSEWMGPETFTTLDCSMPDSLSVMGIDTNVATIIVHHQSADTMFEYRIGRSADIASADTSFIIPADTIEFENLLAATTYYVWVRTACSESDFSNWADSLVFTTDSVNNNNNSIFDAENIGGVMLYPNPTTSRLTIANVEPSAQISIIDMSGREVRSMVNAKGGDRVEVSVADLPRGCYYVRVADAKRQSVNKLILR